MSMFSDVPLMRLVPDLTGLDYEAARAAEREAEVHIADPNPDAPPISNYWWEHQHLVVQHQDPPPGVWIARYDSVRITLTDPNQLHGARTAPHAPLPALSAEARRDGAAGME